MKSFRTGKVYYIEPINANKHRTDWGSFNPGTGKIENKKGAGKYEGAIHPENSMITKENGFDDIHHTKVGESPFSIIDELDKKHPSLE